MFTQYSSVTAVLIVSSTLGEMDADFCGDNGIEYLWSPVWEANGFKGQEDYEEKKETLDSDDDEEVVLKYESNVGWLLDELKEKKNVKEL